MNNDYESRRAISQAETFHYEKLQEAIKASGVSQQQLAEKVGISQAHISRFITGKRGLSFFTYSALCRAIGRDPKDFMTEDAKERLTLELQ